MFLNILRTPSVKTLSKLGLDKTRTKTLKQALISITDTNSVYKALELANNFMGGYGVEGARGVGLESARGAGFHHHYGDIHLLYVNMGEPYATTLVFDTRRLGFAVTSWGNCVEFEPSRFNVW